MRDCGLLALRVTVGGYLAVHGAQKLFGHFDGPGLDTAGISFEHMGLQPGKPFATLAGTTELAGGLLTATGLGSPIGPIAVAGAMAVAVAVHSDKGAMGQKGGFELPLTDMIAALALAATGPGRYSLDRLLRARVPKSLVGLTLLSAAVLSGYSASKVIEHKQEATAAEPAPEEQAEEVPDPAAK
ncbi:MAG: DoxX family protein [Actinomycetota bacterium]|nr:DoxX family protein [Actinomycetota bacterium]